MTLPTLTLGQLREDLERLASVHPASYPTNVIEATHECGEICVDAENDEESLREELKSAEDALEESGREFKEANARADKAEEECQALRAEMEQLHDGEETVATYRERTIAAEKRIEEYCQHMRAANSRVYAIELELKALRARKGMAAGVYKNIQKIRTFLATVYQESKHKAHSETAAALLKEIQTT